MGKRSDQFWDYVVKNDAALQQCMFCKFEFASTSVSWVKYHLARREMGDIRICTEVPDHVREAAELAIDDPNKKLKTGSSLSDHQAQNNTIASSSRRQSDGVENLVNGMEREVMGVQGSGHVVEQWRSPVYVDCMQPFARDTIAEGCRNDGEQMIGESMEPTYMDVYAMGNEAVNMNGDFNVNADSTCFYANYAACSSWVRNDGVENLVNDVERKGGVQRSTSIGVGNHREKVNEELMQPVDMDVSAVGNDAVNSNEDLNMPEDWLPPVPNDRLALDHQMNAMEDTQRMIADQPVTQHFETGRDAISEDGGNSVENMNRRRWGKFLKIGRDAISEDGAVMDVDRENDRLAPDRQMSAVEDTQRMIPVQTVTQPFEIDRDAISEDGGNSVENMNRRRWGKFLKIGRDAIPKDGAVMDVDRENDAGTIAMASAASTPFSSSSLTSGYDVFLSFRGEDTRNGFTDHLHKALVNAGIHTFLDNDSIPRGENIESAIPSAIKSSKVAVIVFSEDFASSRWCLDEVAQIMDCTSSGGLIVIPVFYHVDPSDVRKQSGGYGKAFVAHEKKFKPERVKKWRQALERVANMAGMVLGDRRESKFIEDIIKEVRSRLTTPDEPEPIAHQKTSGVALMTANLIGETFQENIQNIWDCLMKADVFTIGIYGMGGVGKTSLAKHINNQLLETSSPFGTVFWVTVSRHCRIYRLRTRVAKAAGIDVSNEDDQSRKAAILRQGLAGMGNSVLILDDLWESFDLDDVGIPVGERGCKLILTSRSLDVCRRMNSNIIKVMPLSKNEARNLFWETWGRGVALTPEITQVAEEIVKECAGLPLALKTMAGTMKGVADICEWRHVLQALKESEAVEGDMDKDVFRVLKFSYDRLSSTLKQCFLWCALFPEDFHIPSTDLIGHLIAEGIIKGKRSMQADLDEGVFILNKLKQACLLEDWRADFETGVKMHDLLRDMAVQILRGDSKALVEAGKQLKELPDEENWKEDLVRVSLMNNDIEKIPSAYSPNCPNLSTLLLCGNELLRRISGSFFKKLNGLKILDLSGTDIKKLPDSVSELVNLTSLLLSWCERLKHVPSLAKLKALKKLDLSYSGIEEIPHGMEFLSNLVVLDLQDTRLSEQFLIRILPQLSKLQFLDLGNFEIADPRVVASLKKLEFVRFRFSDLCHWNTFIQSLEGLRMYSFIVTPPAVGNYNIDKSLVSKLLAQKNKVYICGLDAINFVELPKDVHQLQIQQCHELKSLCHGCAFPLPTQLKKLCVWICDRMECLHYNLPESLEKLYVDGLKNLCSLLSEGGVAQLQSPFLSIVFSNLKKLDIRRCPRMKVLFPPHLLPNLQNLEQLLVFQCENMVGIIGNGPESSICSTPTPAPIDFALPKLKTLNLSYLPELKSICSGGRKWICNSLQGITVAFCPKLKRMPISLPLVELNGQLSPPSSLQKIDIGQREWWDSVDWGHPNEKSALLPRVVFR